MDFDSLVLLIELQ